MPTKIDQKWWKCDSYYEMGSRNPKAARLGEKESHNSKEGNETAIAERAHIHLEEKNCQCYFLIQHSL